MSNKHETRYLETVASMRIDALDFALRLENRDTIPEIVWSEEPGNFDIGGRHRFLTAWIVRRTVGYDGDRLGGYCSVWNNPYRSSNSWREARHAGLDLQTQLTRLATESGQEPSHLAIRSDGEIAIITEHRHGLADEKKRITTGNLHRSFFLPGKFKDNPEALQIAYAAWQQDLNEAATTYGGLPVFGAEELDTQ